MPHVNTNEFRVGLKVEVDGEPYTMVGTEFVKPGKSQPFTRIKLKHLITGRVIERTYKSGDRIDLADVEDHKVRMLYKEEGGVNFMDETTFDQIFIPNEMLQDKKQWLMEEVVYDLLVYKGLPIDLVPPTFMEMKIVRTEPGLRGDTSGRVLKRAETETGAQVQVPLFIEEGTKIKVDTRTGDYVSRI